jgi:hypothetical protein
MKGSSFMDFIEALKSDPALMERVRKVRQETMADVHRESESIAAIARDSGFDLTEWARRPTDGKRTPQNSDLICLLTCCLMYTSTLDVDDIPG